MKGGAAAYRFRGMPLRIMIAEPTNSVKIIAGRQLHTGGSSFLSPRRCPVLRFTRQAWNYTIGRRKTQGGALTLKRTGILIKCVTAGCWVDISLVSCWPVFACGYGFKFSDTHKWGVHEIVPSDRDTNNTAPKLGTFAQSKIGFTYWREYIQIFQVLKRWQINFQPTEFRTAGSASVFRTQ